MKVYVDFDRTLFDCDRFLGDLYSLINKYNITKEIFKESQNQCRKTGFNPYDILKLVKEKYDFDDNLLIEIDLLMKKTSEYLYSDAIDFLKYLKSLNYEIIILTKGNSNYQREKIFNARIDNYYNKLMVTMKHKGNLKLDYSNGIFIDDNPIEILSILKNNPNRVIRIQRYNSKYSNDLIEFDISNYKSLNDLINSKILE